MNKKATDMYFKKDERIISKADIVSKRESKVRVQTYALHLRMHWKNQNGGKPVDMVEYIEFLKRKYVKKEPFIFGRTHVGDKGIENGSKVPTHFHIYLAVKSQAHGKIDIKNLNILDYKGCHPKILAARGSPQSNFNYINKSIEPTPACKIFCADLKTTVENHWLNDYIKKLHDKTFVSKKSVEKYCYGQYCEGKKLLDVFSEVQDDQQKTFMLCKYKEDLTKLYTNYIDFLTDIEQQKLDKAFVVKYEANERDFQKEAHALLKDQNEREILCLGDTTGNSGKSYLANYLRIKYGAMRTQNVSVKSIAMAYKGQKMVVVDIPRAADIQKLPLKALEKLKDGSIFSEKYGSKEKNFTPPKIIILSNKLPTVNQLRKLTPDRWVRRTIVYNDLTKQRQLSKKGLVNIPQPPKDFEDDDEFNFCID